MPPNPPVSPAPPFIKQVDPGLAWEAHREALEEAALRVLRSGWYVLGKEVEAFEAEFARWLGAGHAVGVGNGTDAVALALRACGVKAGDLVLTVAHTAVASVAAIEQAGAVPVFVDIDPRTHTLCPASLEAALKNLPAGRSAAAVVVVHLYGHAADLPAILSVARAHGLKVIEDCAQSHGARLNGRLTGTWGDAAAFSFYPTKNLAALGDGGAVTTQDDAMADHLRRLRQYGWKKRFISEEPGLNSRLDELQAAFLRVRLPRLDAENQHRRTLAALYHQGLAGLPLTLPPLGEEAVYHQFVVRSTQRDALAQALAVSHIGTAVHYPVPVHLQPAYAGRVPQVVALSETERAAQEVLSLPMHAHLTFEQVERVCHALRTALA